VNNLRVIDATTKNLLNSNVVNIEFGLVFRHSMYASVSNQSTQEVFETKLLGSNRSVDAFYELRLFTKFIGLKAGQTIKQLESLLGPLFKTCEDL
jgi:hypothetical protein